MARRNPNNLRVVLEVGDVCEVSSEKCLTVQDILKASVRQAGISARSLPHFCMAIKKPDSSTKQWLYGTQPVDKTIKDAAKGNALGLHMRFVPVDVDAFVEWDPTAAAYYQKQLHHQLMNNELPISAARTIVQLGCLEMVDYLIKDLRRQRKNKSKTTAQKILKYLEQQIGLQSFLPRAVYSTSSEAAIRSIVAEYFPKAWDLDTEDNIVAAYISTCCGVPNFGTELCQGVVTSPDNIAVGATKGTIMVVPSKGVVFRPDRSPNDVPLGEFSAITKLGITGSRVELQKASGSPDQFTVESLSAARNLATAIDGYRKIVTTRTQSLIFEAQRVPVHTAYGKISRYEAEDCLKKFGALDGLYLVRESVSDPSAFGLSVCLSGEVSHYKISKHKSGKYGIQDGLRYLQLFDLIEHYFKEQDGLCTTLNQNVLELDNVTDLPRAPIIDADGYVEEKPIRPPKQGQKQERKLSDIEISPARLQIGEELGHGEFGTVHLGIWTPRPGKPLEVALKILKAGGSMDQTREFLREANTMVAFDHKYVVKLLGVCTSQPMKLVCELVPLGALRSYLRKESYNLDIKQLLVFIVQIAEGMEYLESVHFVHRDLAARNILVSSPSHIKISDFGLSRSINNDKDYYTSARKGKWPIKWYAPECIYYSKFTHKSDVWSFGITAWEVLMYGKKPYKGFTGRQVVQYIEDGGRLPKPGDYCPDELYAILQSCWLKEMEDRPDFSKLRVDVARVQDQLDRLERATDNADDVYQTAIESQKFFDVEQSPAEVDAEEAEDETLVDSGRLSRTIMCSPAHIRVEYLSFGDPIGEGHYGPVLSGVLSTPDGQQNKVALKKLKPAKGGKQRQHFWKEAEIMASLSHDNVVRLFGVAASSKGDMLVCELVPLGAINSYLQTNKVPLDHLIRFATQIASGMAYMESRRFIHRDLAARNVLVSTPSVCKIADFGLSRALSLDSDYYRSQQKGRWPIKWYAPEALLQSKFSHKGDVWSFGVTFWEVLSYGEKPFKGMKGRQVLQMLSKGERLKAPGHTPKWACELLSKCWQEDPTKRPSFDEIYTTLVNKR